MPRISIPANYKYSGIEQGELLGNLYLTKNIDLIRNRGKLTLGDSLTAQANSSSLSNLTTPVAFVRTAADGTDRWWALGGKLFKTTNTDPEAGWAQDAIASTPTAPLYDMIEFQDALLVATSTDIDRLSTTWTTNWWSGLSGDPVAMTANPHRFEIFAGAVLFTDGRFINTWDGTIGTDPALTLPNDFIATWIRSTADWAVIGTQSTTDREAEIFFWDRTSSTFNARYGIGDNEALCGFVVYGIPYIVTKRGEIKKFTGQGFRTVQNFPTVELGLQISDIHPNGVSVSENIVKLNVNFGASTSYDYTILRPLSGIWTFDALENTLTHSNSLPNSVADDFGQLEVSAVGAITAVPVTQGKYLVGGTCYTVYTGTTRAVIATFDETSTSNRGYIITPKIQAKDVNRFWRSFFLKYRRLDNSSDRIKIYYRFQDSNTLPAYETITWASATTFTGSNANVAANDLVEILAGPNAGAIARITTKAGSAPFTFTIDTSLNASTSAARARYLNFIELGTVSDQTTQTKLFYLSTRSNWMQFLIYFIGTETSPQLEQMIIDYSDLAL